MNRRKFIVGSTASLGVLSLSGITWMSIEAGDKPLQIKSIFNYIEKMRSGEIYATGEWSLPKILSHCAQSVEYSMLGFPEHKSEIFKSTLGSLAFSAFTAKSKMRHNLAEAIPGAPSLTSVTNLENAYARLEQSIKDFLAFNGKLHDHFAFGSLTKDEYEQAHAMHFFNHLEEIKFKTNLSIPDS